MVVVKNGDESHGFESVKNHQLNKQNDASFPPLESVEFTNNQIQATRIIRTSW